MEHASMEDTSMKDASMETASMEAASMEKQGRDRDNVAQGLDKEGTKADSGSTAGQKQSMFWAKARHDSPAVLFDAGRHKGIEVQRGLKVCEKTFLGQACRCWSCEGRTLPAFSLPCPRTDPDH